LLFAPWFYKQGDKLEPSQKVDSREDLNQAICLLNDQPSGFHRNISKEVHLRRLLGYSKLRPERLPKIAASKTPHKPVDTIEVTILSMLKERPSWLALLDKLIGSQATKNVLVKVRIINPERAIIVRSDTLGC
jgi:hypothetical protein